MSQNRKDTYSERFDYYILEYKEKKLSLRPVKNKHYYNYHKIGDIGERDCSKRVSKFNINDIKDKTILDIGCSMGGMLIEFQKLGAKKLLGLDHNKESIDFINDYCLKNNINNLTAEVQDIDDFDWFRKLNKFDTVLLLSVLNTSKFSEKLSLISTACRLGNVLYLEGHHNESHLEYMKYLYYYTNYTHFEYSYNQSRGKRPLIRCSYEKPFDKSKKDFTKGNI